MTGVLAAALDLHLKVPTNWVTQILNGCRAISGDTSIRLAHFSGTSAQFWMKLQALYEVKCAQHKMEKPLRTTGPPRLLAKQLREFDV